MMRTAAEWLTPVKASGMAAYLIASLSCAAAATLGRVRRTTRLAAVLCVLYLALFFDIAADWRWKLYDWLRSDAVSLHWYNQRTGPQIAVLGFIAVGLLIAGLWLRRRFASVRGAPLAICGALLSIGCWLTEVVSLHAVDALLYQRIGSLMAVSFVWMLTGLMTTAGILMAAVSSNHKM